MGKALWEKEREKKQGVVGDVLKEEPQTSLVAQWLRIHMPMQGTRIRVLVQEDPHAAEQLSPCATTTEACAPRACALQQEKPPQ